MDTQDCGVPSTKYAPEYDGTCAICGRGPLVVVMDSDGNVVRSSTLCGACHFVDPACIVPANWPILLEEYQQ